MSPGRAQRHKAQAWTGVWFEKTKILLTPMFSKLSALTRYSFTELGELTT